MFRRSWLQFPSGTHIFSLSHARVKLTNPSLNTMHVSANFCRLHCFHFSSLTRAYAQRRDHSREELSTNIKTANLVIGEMFGSYEGFHKLQTFWVAKALMNSYSPFKILSF